MMWILAVVLLVGIFIVCLKLNSMRLKLQQQMKHLTPMIQVVENAKDILYYCDTKPKLKYRYLSPVIDNILGPNSLKEHLHCSDKIYEIVHPDDYETLLKKTTGNLDYSKPIILRLKRYDGKYIWFEEYATPIYENSEVVAVQGIYRNINEKVELQKKLEYKVSHDALTNIYNREYFETKFYYYDNESNVPVAIVICDLDELKFINDQFGHKMGDVLIQEAAKLLYKISSEKEIVARIGGDEFAIILIDTNPSQIEVFLANLQNEIDLFNSSNHTFYIKMSKGYAYSSSSISKMKQLFIEADNKMYVEKRKKKKDLTLELV
ncbi:diguanylate cyclase domain-containing protein [Rummeliibacillus sp. NPDC094406]|uniref:sensor domain-containing diguanylate cyclase n=1 Tax=Rummeliibacillus sp. NPDC094406 TaxID=3364511 RepID=UPI003808AABF